MPIDILWVLSFGMLLCVLTANTRPYTHTHIMLIDILWVLSFGMLLCVLTADTRLYTHTHISCLLTFFGC